jgi:RNA polymerase sigma-B factor
MRTSIDGHLPDLLTGRSTVAGLIRMLPPRVQRMVALRLDGHHSDAEIAAELGFTAAHVAQVLPRALGWLRAAMLSDVPPSWTGDEPAGLPGLVVHLRQTDSGLVVRVAGEIDRDVSDRLRHRLGCAVALAEAGPLTLDLSGVPLIDAAGTAVLCEALRVAEASQVRVRLCGIQPQVAVVLNAVGPIVATG